jgi:DNA recombination protein RmuC
MQGTIEIGILILLLTVVALQALLLRRRPAPPVDLAPLAARTEAMERAQERMERGIREEIGRNRDEAARESQGLRQELQAALATFNSGLRDEITAMSAAHKLQLNTTASESQARLNQIREEFLTSSHRSRTEANDSLKAFSDSLMKNVTGIAAAQTTELARLSQTTDQKLEAVRATVEARLKSLQEENTLKLEQMRHTVDEQLQSTLEKRLGESFKMVSDRLEQVHRGLGEMQSLANGVGDLKKLLSNVRVRGTWGEVQLGMLLEQILTPEQYGTNVATTGTAERVEFAIKLPGGEDGGTIWLPVDAKFPKEDYERLLDATERADVAGVEESCRQLELRIKLCAKDIATKYIEPPKTTDFAILYLPTEGLYAEALRRVGLFETLQREYHVTVAGPTTLSALLNSLQMGFRTLAIQKRSSEVWVLLGEVKTQFGKYADILAKVQKKLQEANNTVESGLTRTRAIQRKLKNVQELGAPGATTEAVEFAELEGEETALSANPE